jgi:hypothetical protein
LLELFADAASAGVPPEFVPDGVGAGGDAEGIPEAVEVRTGDAVAVDAAVRLSASPAGAGVVGGYRTLLSANATGTPAAASDLAGLAHPAAAGATQVPARPSASPAAVNMALMCATLSVAIPATSATVRSPIRRVRDRAGKSRYLRASRRRYERTLR